MAEKLGTSPQQSQPVSSPGFHPPLTIASRSQFSIRLEPAEGRPPSFPKHLFHDQPERGNMSYRAMCIGLCAAVCLFLGLAPVSLRAQIDHANVNGTVVDPSGVVVAGAKVDALSSETGKVRQVVTNAQGI